MNRKLYEKIGESHILVNATKVGMKPMEEESLIKDTRVFREDLVVADAVYNPRETKNAAGSAGRRVQNRTGRYRYASSSGGSSFPDFYRREYAHGGSL